MALLDDTAQGRAQCWHALAALHARIDTRIERALRVTCRLGLKEYLVLEVLSREDEWRMNQLAAVIGLSPSATTRLVHRMEQQGLLARHLCPTDRRGISTEVSDAGRGLLAAARPVHDAALGEALAEASALPGSAPLVQLLDTWAPLVKRGKP
ncbi:MarR family winged helix-turn-helix transcriptional regulator [Streptomyces violaceusniger]|uniref:MarR family winged helix-turn-helix transcriptional regulator n=1 Tax=Streptomyces violaceusniger TaxID=68280 RepID=UPI0036B68E9B